MQRANHCAKRKTPHTPSRRRHPPHHRFHPPHAPVAPPTRIYRRTMTTTISPTPASSYDTEDEDEGPPPQEQSSWQFAISPQRMPRLPHLDSSFTQLLNPFQSLNPSNATFPDYGILLDFQDKTSLLGWKILTDAELNGNSEASIAWGTAKNPISGETMRTLVFQGRLGEVIAPAEAMKNDSYDDSITSRITKRLFKKSSTTNDQAQADHSKLMQTIAQDRNVDYGDDDLDDNTEYGAMNGFVGLMSPAFIPPLDLSRWDTLNICVRTDGGPWLASLKPEAGVSDELWVAGLPGPNGNVVNPRQTTGFMRRPLRNLFVPIERLNVTHAGRTHTRQVADNRQPAQGFGFSIRGPPGPFKIELGWIAVANSQSRIIQHQTVTSPSMNLNVELARSTVKHTVGLSDEKLYDFTVQHKSVLDDLIKERAKDVQIATGKNSIDIHNIISVAEINCGVMPMHRRRELIAKKLGKDVGDIELKTSVGTNILPAMRKDDALHKLDQELEDFTREWEDSGLTMMDVQNRSEIKEKSGIQENTAEYENKIFRLQQHAKILAQTDVPLIVPTFSEIDVMKRSRLAAVQMGYISEEQFKSYAGAVDPHEMDKTQKIISAAKTREEYNALKGYSVDKFNYYDEEGLDERATQNNPLLVKPRVNNGDSEVEEQLLESFKRANMQNDDLSNHSEFTNTPKTSLSHANFAEQARLWQLEEEEDAHKGQM